MKNKILRWLERNSDVEKSRNTIILNLKGIPVYDSHGKCNYFSISDISENNEKRTKYNSSSFVSTPDKQGWGRKLIPSGLITQLDCAQRYQTHPLHEEISRLGLEDRFFQETYVAEGIERDFTNDLVYLIKNMFNTSRHKEMPIIKGKKIPNSEIIYGKNFSGIKSTDIKTLFKLAPGLSSQLTGFKDLNDITKKLGRFANNYFKGQSGVNLLCVGLSEQIRFNDLNEGITERYSTDNRAGRILTARFKVK